MDFSTYECKYLKPFAHEHLNIGLLCANSIRDGKRLIYKSRKLKLFYRHVFVVIRYKTSHPGRMSNKYGLCIFYFIC